jgi:hypothetical protein
MCGGKVARAYERFLELPVSIVSAVLWFMGLALAGLCVLMLYCLWLLLNKLART